MTDKGTVGDIMTKILLVDDEEKSLKVLSRSLHMLGYSTVAISSPKDALDVVAGESPDIVIADLVMPYISGIELLEQVKKVSPSLPVIVLTGYGTVKTAVDAMKKGAFDYVTKPYNIEEVDLIIKRALEQRALYIENKMLKEKILKRFPFSSIITHDAAMKKLLKEVQTLANTESTVLITGESGTGKELIAKALHFSGNRQNRPFITIDCGGLPESILESEIFGHVKGSFTGACADKKGYLEVAEEGTVFFDEVGELPFVLQKKLLRVTQEKEFSRVGDTKTRRINIRIVAATNRDLKKEVRAERFREDLFYRLNVISLNVPPLRERRQDIPLLVNYFLSEFNARLEKRVTAVDDGAYRRIMAYCWPGNVRELRNAIERIVALKEGSVVTPDDLPDEITSLFSAEADLLPAFKAFKEEVLANETKEYILTLLAMFEGNVSKAAAKANLDRGNFRKLLKRFNVSANDYRR